MQRRLGSGAYGVVYEAYDCQASSLVAVKVLHNADADALYRFKKGFRSLADIRHDNLISFNELLSEGGFWFFTMELIGGADFIEYLRGGKGDRHSTGGSSVERFSSGFWDDETPPPEAAPPPPQIDLPDLEQLSRVLRQLCQGLDTLHRHGKLHRDIKPSNVLVTGEERVVVLDFGLVAELEEYLESLIAPMLGTPAYMSPEQAQGLPCSPASDWYSVGVMLFEALTGELPFKGSLPEMIHCKQEGIWPRELLLTAGVPEDLCYLCDGLLKPDPKKRPDSDAIFKSLGISTRATGEVVLPAVPEGSFVGRRDLLDELHQALEASRRGAVPVYIRGVSGIGKSALVHHFLDHLEASGEDAVVLIGRCFLQESVPYKAFDSLIDALTRYLRSLPDHQAEVLLPTQMSALVRLFPVLRRVPSVARGAHHGGEDVDPHELRRRAAVALRQLLARLAERRTLILFIDDLQWGDADSFALLEQLLRPPDPPALLLIGCFRSEDESNSAFLRHLAEHRVVLETRGIGVRELELAELNAEEARQLVETAIDREGFELTAEQAGKIVREAGGSPFFLVELVHGFGAATAGDGEGDVQGFATGEVQLRDVILARVEDLNEEGKRLLEVVAVAGRPVDREVAAEAAQLSARTSTIASLHDAKLIRLQAADEREEIEIYHDRIRETLIEQLSEDDLRLYHRRLAVALESSGRAEPETLAMHFQATAEEEDRARRYATTAAARAEEALAFDRAARLYRMAIDLLSAESEEQYDLRVKLGDALANAGHSREAADTFLRAASDSGSINPFEAQRSAAENLLISGHIERGMTVLRHVLRAVGMELEPHPTRVMLELWWRRLQLWLRDFRFTPRSPSEIDAETLRKIDICWSAETGLCLVDVLHASLFHARHLLLALAVGEPQRVARGLAMEVFFGAMEGGDSNRALDLARELAGRVEGTYAASLTEMASGMLACSKGAWKSASRRLVRAEKYLRETGTGVTWELDTVHHFRVIALLHLGRWKDLFGELPTLLRGARERRDLYLEVHLQYWVVSLRHLTQDEPEKAAAAIREGSRCWSRRGFHYQHFGQLMAEVQAALYGGQGLVAWRLVSEHWTKLGQSMLQRIEMVLVQSFDLRARTALAAAGDAGLSDADRRRLLAQARRDARKIARARSNWAIGLAELIRAGCADGKGQREAAIDHLRQAEAAFEASHMAIHAAVARRRRGQLEAVKLGAETVAAAEAELRQQGIQSPPKVCSMLAPGTWERSDSEPG